MKGVIGKIALGCTVLAILCTMCAAEPSLAITGKMTSGQKEITLVESWKPIEGFGSLGMPQTQSDQGKTFRISMKNTGTQKVSVTKIEVTFSADQSNLLFSEKAKKGFLYTDTRFAGETIEPKGYFNTSFTLTAGNLDYFISNDLMDYMRQSQVRLRLNLFNENQMLGSGWTATILLKNSRISSLTNAKLPDSDTFSFVSNG